MELLKSYLQQIYPNEHSKDIYKQLEVKLNSFMKKDVKQRKQNWDEKDVVLITYGDQFQEKGKPTLATLKTIYDRYLAEAFEVIHILPFYPYSSDDGFSVIDYQKIHADMGDWQDVSQLATSVRLMFDFVCNHISAQSEWFQKYLQLDPEFDQYFVEMSIETDLSAVTRPRPFPLLTAFTLADQRNVHVWTTFSEDQIDLNFHNPKVLLHMIDILLFYIENGAEYIRLDAVGFMWKKVGTNCMHLPETHLIIQLFRAIVNEVSPGTVLITETNVPHKDNIAYFGDGHNEAQMVYQFPLPPLVLHALHYGNGERLTAWAKNLQLPESDTTFFNFLASHDGIGLNPIRGLIAEEEILTLVESLEEEGALVSYKNNPNGSTSPYEVNVTYLNALSKRNEPEEIKLQRFLLAHSILLGFPGVPAIYIQSLLGASNDLAGVEHTGRNRSINRRKYQLNEVDEMLELDTFNQKTYREMLHMIATRKASSVFHPNAPMEVLNEGNSLFCFKRRDAEQEVLLVHNLTNQSIDYQLSGCYRDLLTMKQFQGDIKLLPYQFLWLTPVE